MELMKPTFTKITKVLSKTAQQLEKLADSERKVAVDKASKAQGLKYESEWHDKEAVRAKKVAQNLNDLLAA